MTSRQQLAVLSVVLASSALLAALAAVSLGPLESSHPQNSSPDGEGDVRRLREEPFAEIVFVNIPAGEFTMSFSSVPRALGEFWIGKYEITNEEFRRFRTDHAGEAKLPVSRITWEEARDFCEKLGFQLPTEAQWEYAARSGGKAEYSMNDEVRLDIYAWYGDNSDLMPHPVGVKKSSPWGLHDMYGNVSEWVADWYSDQPEDIGTTFKDPAGPQAGSTRVFRGGSHRDPMRVMASAERRYARPNMANSQIGFRCAFRERGLSGEI